MNGVGGGVPSYVSITSFSSSLFTTLSVAENAQNNGVRCQIPQTGSIVDFPRLLLDLAIKKYILFVTPQY